MDTKQTTMDAQQFLAGYFGKLQDTLDVVEERLEESLPRMVEALEEARATGATIYTMGNGGSGAAASHLTNDLNKYTIEDGQPRYRSVSLVDNTPVLLAWANDQDYDDVFVEQLRNLLDPEDVLIGISGSGESENCVRALEYANQLGATTISWTGFGGGRMAEISDVSTVIPSDSMVRCEDVHVIIHHTLVSYLSERTQSTEEGAR